jgi:hypothetical protein
MIVFDLTCSPAGHRFEGWFASTFAFEEQVKRALVTCPQCGSADVIKAVMAPSVGRKGNQQAVKSATRVPVSGGKLPPAAQELMSKMAAMQAQALQNSTWVGDKFVDLSRAMHYGESAQTTIHGEATLAEASQLIEEGIAVVPLPFPVAPPDEVN